MAARPGKRKIAAAQELLMGAVESRREEEVRHALVDGADPLLIAPGTDFSPATIAIRRGFTQGVSLMLAHCPGIGRHSGIDGWTYLMDAAFHEREDIFSLLLPHSDPHAVNDSGADILMVAAAGGSAQLVRRALPLCDPMRKNNLGTTALMIAVETEGWDCALLLAPVSDLQARNAKGESLWELAAKSDEGAPEWLKALAEEGELRASLPSAAPVARKARI